MTRTWTLGVSVTAAFLFAAVLVVSALGSATVDAARGGGGKDRGSTAAIAVSPNPAPAGITEVTVTGTGFKAGEGVNVGIPGVVPSYSVVTDASGGFSLTYTRAGSPPFTPGEYTFQAFSWKRNSWVLAATTTLVVQ